MIGKQVKGKSFRGVLNYLHSKEDSKLIGGNMFGKSPRTLAAEFKAARDLNPRLQKAVYHASLSLPKTEQLDDESWNAIADDYMQGMGFEGSQYVVYRHHDTDHDHAHIVASRTRITDGSTVNDSWERLRSQNVIRKLEQDYQLEEVAPSWEHERRGQTTGERRQLDRTQEGSQRKKLQDSIDDAAQDGLTMPQLLVRLKDDGIDAQVKFTRTGQVKGISYGTEDGFAFSGTKLGQAYTFPGLQKHRGVSYDPQMMREIVTTNRRSPATPQQQRDQQQQRTQTVAPIAAYFLNNEGETHFEGSDHTINWDKESQTMSLTENLSGRTVMKAEWDGEQWQDRGSSLNQDLTDYFDTVVFPKAKENRQALEEEQRQRQRERERQRGLEL